MHEFSKAHRICSSIASAPVALKVGFVGECGAAIRHVWTWCWGDPPAIPGANVPCVQAWRLHVLLIYP